MITLYFKENVILSFQVTPNTNTCSQNILRFSRDATENYYFRDIYCKKSKILILSYSCVSVSFQRNVGFCNDERDKLMLEAEVEVI